MLFGWPRSARSGGRRRRPAPSVSGANHRGARQFASTRDRRHPWPLLYGRARTRVGRDILMCGTSATFADTHAKWALMRSGVESTPAAPHWYCQGEGNDDDLRDVYRPRSTGMGLVNICVPDDQLDAEILKLRDHPAKFLIQPSGTSNCCPTPTQCRSRRDSLTRSIARLEWTGHAGTHRRVHE